MTMATKEGEAVLGKYLTVHRVLFVPKLSCNLVSVSKLIEETGCDF